MPYNRDMAEAYWLTPVGSDNKQTAEMVILALVGAGSVYTALVKGPREEASSNQETGYASTLPVKALLLMQEFSRFQTGYLIRELKTLHGILGFVSWPMRSCILTILYPLTLRQERRSRLSRTGIQGKRGHGS